MKKLCIMLLLAGSANAQWVPILGFQSDESLGNFSYYTSDQNDALEKCEAVLKLNDVDLETIEIDKNHDPIINSHLRKPEQPDMVYVVYIAKTVSGYAVRLKFFKDEYTEFEEDFMVIVSGDRIGRPSIKEILGNPVRIGNIEVAQFDFEDALTWAEAQAACAKLGKGWRLPSYEELVFMSKYRSNFNMNDPTYWSANINKLGTEAEVYNFSKTTSFYKDIHAVHHVRAVRTFRSIRRE